jgi:hypothetical protein
MEKLLVKNHRIKIFTFKSSDIIQNIFQIKFDDDLSDEI